MVLQETVAVMLLLVLLAARTSFSALQVLLFWLLRKEMLISKDVDFTE